MRINKVQNYNKNNNVSFGWMAKTHSYITQSAINKVPEILPYKKFLQLGSIIPDIRLSQTSLLGSNAHNWNGKTFNCYDIVPQNAADFFCDLLSKAFMYLGQGNNELAMYKAGETLHFLQDMAVPIHTKKECQGFFKLIKHINYERQARQNHDLLDNLSFNPKKVETKNLYELFNDLYKKASLMENPMGKKVNRKTSIETALTNAFDSTCMFLKRFADISSASSSERQKLIVDEFMFFVN